VVDIHQRVTSLEERAQAHDTGIGELRKDIADLRVELRTSAAELRTEIAAVRSDMAHRSDVAELRKEIAAIRGEMAHRSDIADLRGEMGTLRGEMADLRRDMNERFVGMDQKFTWLVGIQVAGLVAVIAALVGSYYQ
jgi:predicted  nucleic acid-binding Zn-ribbon protein